MEYKIGSIDFQGPLDLLLELIKANKCDIKEIFIKDIIEQYLEIIRNENKNNCEIASEFIVMASTLIELKSRYFIFINDKSDEEEDPGKELYDLLEQYRYYKAISVMLKERYENTQVLYTNKGAEILIEETVDFSTYTVIDIFAMYSKFVKESKRMVRSNLVSYKKISVEDKIFEIEQILDRLSKVYFDKIVNGQIKDDVVASLLGVLELSKEQKVLLSQKRIFDSILIERMGDGN
ncbi:MAG: segregation/condensation protein A [Peptostreptococcaceae bacterium]|nr:segregation/condensation protein A [Peptostreptococcaceae bacterium]